MRHKIIIACLLTCCFGTISGCSLDEVFNLDVSKNACKGVKSLEIYTFDEHGKVKSRELCSEGDACTKDNNYRGALKYGICPDDISICQTGEDGVYCSVCERDKILCERNKNCVDPLTDNEHCGARGYCNSDDKESEHYAGQKCDTANGFSCVNGECFSERACEAGVKYPTCEGQNVVKCVSNKTQVSDTCDDKLTTCVEGACVPKQCDLNGKDDLCDLKKPNIRLFCNNGVMDQQNCEEIGKVCVAGECKTQKCEELNIIDKTCDGQVYRTCDSEGRVEYKTCGDAETCVDGEGCGVQCDRDSCDSSNPQLVKICRSGVFEDQLCDKDMYCKDAKCVCSIGEKRCSEQGVEVCVEKNGAYGWELIEACTSDKPLCDAEGFFCHDGIRGIGSPCQLVIKENDKNHTEDDDPVVKRCEDISLKIEILKNEYDKNKKELTSDYTRRTQCERVWDSYLSRKCSCLDLEADCDFDNEYKKFMKSISGKERKASYINMNKILLESTYASECYCTALRKKIEQQSNTGGGMAAQELAEWKMIYDNYCATDKVFFCREVLESIKVSPRLQSFYNAFCVDIVSGNMFGGFINTDRLSEMFGINPFSLQSVSFLLESIEKFFEYENNIFPANAKTRIRGCENVVVPEGMSLGCITPNSQITIMDMSTFWNGLSMMLSYGFLKWINTFVNEVFNQRVDFDAPNGYCVVGAYDLTLSGYAFDVFFSRAPVCGDGIVDPGEACEPDSTNADWCKDCRITTCGNGKVDDHEECDGETGLSDSQVCLDTCMLSKIYNEKPVIHPGYHDDSQTIGMADLINTAARHTEAVNAVCPEGTRKFSYTEPEILEEEYPEDNIPLTDFVGRLGYDVCLKACETDKDCRENYKCLDLPTRAPCLNETVEDVINGGESQKACLSPKLFEVFSTMRNLVFQHDREESLDPESDYYAPECNKDKSCCGSLEKDWKTPNASYVLNYPIE
ncbi:MAG: hypothetical protein II180_12050 [Proteobacteria bacterium]|nr:hypothetical protein [Pseudomonadota bacterium]